MEETIVERVEPAIEGEEGERPQEAERVEAISALHKWYVIHTYSGYENKVKANLEKRLRVMGLDGKVSEILIPTEEVAEIKGGKRRILTKKFFPGYILIKMEMADDSWHVVRHTPGVFGFIGERNKPTPLKEEDVENILRQIGTGATKIRPAYEFVVGESVRVTEGPFATFIGVVEEIGLKKETVRIMLNILGRNTPVELGFTQIERL